MGQRNGVQLELSSWPRADLFRHFLGYAQPQFAITTRLDAGALMAASADARATGAEPVSLYRACLYAMGAAANEVEAFRRRLVHERTGAPNAAVVDAAVVGVEVYPSVDLSSTVALPGAGFTFGYTDFDPHWPSFETACAASDERVRADGVPATISTRRDLVYLSCLPWVDVHGMTQAVAGPADDVPRVAWGKIIERDGRYEFGCSVTVHHALVDGGDVADFFAAAQQVLDRTAFRPGLPRTPREISETG